MGNPTDESQSQLRVGAAALGLLSGLIIGGLLAVGLLALRVIQAGSIAPWVFGTSLSLAVVCFFWPSVAFVATFGLAHFIIGATQGAAAGSSLEIPAPEPDTSSWLKFLFWVGVALGVGVCVALWLW